MNVFIKTLIKTLYLPESLPCVGVTSDIPDGWHLCDGTNGTPNLKDRFIVGAGNSYSVGDTGGSESVTLSEDQIPSHTHEVDDPGHNHAFPSGSNYSTASMPFAGSGRTQSSSPNINTWTSETGITIGSTGGGASHENRPSYYALAFIMKL